MDDEWKEVKFKVIHKTNNRIVAVPLNVVRRLPNNEVSKDLNMRCLK